jgi:succinoglycan biosynthesis transport protein ExoP
MTPPTTQTPGRPTPTPRAAQPAPTGAGAALAIDPVKLLIKYKWLLIGTAIAGAVIGTVSHLVLIRVYPIFRAEAIFECLPPETDATVITPMHIDQNAMELFMGTQVDRMKSEPVLTAVVNDPRLAAEAPNWSRPYMRGGSFDTVNALEDIRKIVRASILPNTYLIRMSASTNHRNDAAGIVRLLRELYMEQATAVSTRDINRRKQVARNTILASERQLEELNTKRTRLVQDKRLDTLDGQRSQTGESLRVVNFQLINLQQQIEAATVSLEQDEAQLQRGTGIQYDNTLRLAVDNSPQVLQLQQTLNAYESELATMRQIGILPDHRNFRLMQSAIEGHRQQIELTRERLLREAFESRVDQYRLAIQQFRAQEADLLKQVEELSEEMIELTRIVGEVSDIDRSIETTIRMIADQQMKMAELDAAASLPSVVRIRVVQSETVPDVPAFPKLYIMIPLGIILLTGLVTGTVLVLEILDQRVKGPSDLAALGRIPVLGLVPDAAEDPSQPEHPESVFRDIPGSVMAEHYRQIRTRVAKAMVKGGHKTLLVVGATPGSGATSVVSNLGSAMVSAGNKVLVVDANFRRPRLHAAFDAPESPGLSDVLSGATDFNSAVISKGSGPDLLAAGTAKNRMVEQLGSDAVETLLAELRTRYDYILIDVAPALVAGDAQSLANRCDASMLVARAMHEKRGMVARLRNELAESRAEFLGAMVNAVRSSAGGYMRKNIRTQANYAADAAGQPA